MKIPNILKLRNWVQDYQRKLKNELPIANPISVKDHFRNFVRTLEIKDGGIQNIPDQLPLELINKGKDVCCIHPIAQLLNGFPVECSLWTSKTENKTMWILSTDEYVYYYDSDGKYLNKNYCRFHPNAPDWLKALDGHYL